MPGRKRTDNQKIKNVTCTPNNNFYFLNVCPFSPGGFFTFLVVVAHGVASEFGKNSSRTLTRNKQMDLSIVQNLHDFLFSVSAIIWLVLKNV